MVELVMLRTAGAARGSIALEVIRDWVPQSKDFRTRRSPGEAFSLGQAPAGGLL